MTTTKASDLEPGDLIHYPSDSDEWVEVYEVGDDIRKGNEGNVYVAIEDYGSASWHPDKEVETKD